MNRLCGLRAAIGTAIANAPHLRAPKAFRVILWQMVQKVRHGHGKDAAINHYADRLPALLTEFDHAAETAAYTKSRWRIDQSLSGMSKLASP